MNYPDDRITIHFNYKHVDYRCMLVDLDIAMKNNRDDPTIYQLFDELGLYEAEIWSDIYFILKEEVIDDRYSTETI